jgi:hypothetical protein
MLDARVNRIFFLWQHNLHIAMNSFMNLNIKITLDGEIHVYREVVLNSNDVNWHIISVGNYSKGDLEDVDHGYG